jgi:hypothetical protein
MTVFSEPIENIAGADNATVFSFTAGVPRESSSGTALITTRTVQYTPSAGVLTTGDLDPGPALVRVGSGPSVWIDIPDSGTPVRFWPVYEAGLPVPPTQEAAAVRNGGGIARMQRITATAYAALSTPDPETFYVVVPG